MKWNQNEIFHWLIFIEAICLHYYLLMLTFDLLSSDFNLTYFILESFLHMASRCAVAILVCHYSHSDDDIVETKQQQSEVITLHICHTLKHSKTLFAKVLQHKFLRACKTFSDSSVIQMAITNDFPCISYRSSYILVCQSVFLLTKLSKGRDFSRENVRITFFYCSG